MSKKISNPPPPYDPRSMRAQAQTGIDKEQPGLKKRPPPPPPPPPIKKV